MVKSLDLGYTDTAFATPDMTQELGLINWGADWAPVESAPGQVTYRNLSSPTDRVEEATIIVRDVDNIYGGTGVETAFRAPSSKGTQIVGKMKQTWAVTDSEDAAFVRHLPVSVVVTITAPKDPLVGASELQEFLLRSASLFFEQNDNSNLGMQRLVRGVVTKKVFD